MLRPESPIPVSRSWLDPTLQTGNVYDGGVKVENLWVCPLLQALSQSSLYLDRFFR